MTDCVHYWNIEVATGPQSDGICRYCGVRRSFNNSIYDPPGISLETEKSGYRWRDIRIRDKGLNKPSRSKNTQGL